MSTDTDIDKRLLRFEPDDWPGNLHEAMAAWQKSRYDYVADHPGGVLGSHLDVLIEHVATRRRVYYSSPGTE